VTNSQDGGGHENCWRDFYVDLGCIILFVTIVVVFTEVGFIKGWMSAQPLAAVLCRLHCPGGFSRLSLWELADRSCI
jgi:hypothetical protein